MHIIKREMYLQQIRPFFNKDIIKVITGMRRTGKSVLLELIRLEILSQGISEYQCITFNFESLKYNHLTNFSALYQEIMSLANKIDGKVYIFLDEIQNVKDFEKCIASLRVDLDCDIYITGSNATLLGGELATLLAGRYVQFLIYPFSFAEFIVLYRQSNPQEDLDKIFKQYLILGGIPSSNICNFEVEYTFRYLRDIFNSVELKDIIQRYNFKDLDLLERLILYITARNYIFRIFAIKIFKK